MAASAKMRESSRLESMLMEAEMEAAVDAVRRRRTVVVDDSPGYVEVVCALLSLDDAIDVVGRASDGAEAIQMVAELSPDLVLMDVHMPGMSGLRAAALLNDFFPETVVVLMSAEELPAAITIGACGFVRKAHFVEDSRRVLNAIW